MYNIIPLIIILVSLAIILSIIFKKMSLLAGFDISSIPEEKAAETKTKIMEERLARKAKVFYNKIVPLFKIVANFFQRKFKAFSEKLKNLDEKYKARAQKEVLTTKKEFENSEKETAGSLKEADDLVSQELYDEAEKKYIRLLSLDPKNIEAFRGLGNLYIMQKQYDEARQTFEHILKLDNSYGLAYFELGEIFYKLESYEKALLNLEKALAIEPNNPKYLDLLITISLIIKDKNLAKQSLERLKETNPDNAKIEEFETKIKEL